MWRVCVLALLLAGCRVKRRVVAPAELRAHLAALERNGRAAIETRRPDQGDDTELREIEIDQTVEVDGVEMPLGELTRGCLERACPLDTAGPITVERWKDLDGRWVAAVTVGALAGGLGLAMWASDTSPAWPDAWSREENVQAAVGVVLGVGVVAFWVWFVNGLIEEGEKH